MRSALLALGAAVAVAEASGPALTPAHSVTRGLRQDLVSYVPDAALPGADAVSYTTLVYGQMQRDSFAVPPNTNLYSQWKYYKYTYQGGGTGITFYVGQLTGDVDMFLGDASKPVPTQTNFTDASASTYSEIINIAPTDCPNAPCDYYIGITPFLNMNSSYFIIVLNDTAAVPLIDGVPHADTAFANDDMYFTASFTPVSSESFLELSLAVSSGSIFTYVSIGSGTVLPPSGASDSDYDMWGSGVIVISAASPVFQASNCKLGSVCNIAITVMGYEESSKFYITATADVSAQELVNAVPTSGYVGAGQYQYYYLTVPAPVDLQFIVSAVAGDPDIFVSCVNERPVSSTNHTWYAVGLGDEVLPISASDPSYPTTFPATFYIGVQAFGNANATFTLTAIQETANFTVMLADGQPQAGSVDAWTFDYYTFIYNGTKTGPASWVGLDVSATVSSGDVDIYISTGTQYDPVSGHPIPILPTVACVSEGSNGQCLEWQVDPATYTWSSAGSTYGTSDLVTIPKPALIQGQAYFVGILGTSPSNDNYAPPPAMYTLVASTGRTLIELQDGMPTVGAVGALQQKFYRYTVSVANADILITGTLVDGNIDIYASETVTTPGPGNSTWSNAGQRGFQRDDVLYIPYEQLSSGCRFVVALGFTCSLYIGVRGANYPAGVTNVYTMTASATGSTSSPITLANGKAQFSYVKQYATQYYYSYLDFARGQTLYLSVQDWGEASTSMYVNLGANKTWYLPAPGANNPAPADYVSNDLGGYNRLILGPRGLGDSPHADADVQSGKKELALRPVASLPGGGFVLGLATEEAARRVLSAAEEASPEVVDYLMDGGKVVRALTWERDGEYLHRYRPDLAAVRASKAGAARALAAAEAGGEVAAIQYCYNCPMYVSLFGTEESFYTITYAAGATYQPLPDSVQTFGLALGDYSYTYFAYTTEDPLANVTFAFTSYYGTFTAYIAVQNPALPYRLPSASQFTWALSPWKGDSSITINYNDPNSCQSKQGTPCVYLIGVQSNSPNNASAYFSINAVGNSGAAPEMMDLEDSTPVNGRITEGDIVYYTYDLSNSTAVVLPPVWLSMNTLTGRARMFVNNVYNPEAHDYNQLPGPNYGGCQWVTNNFTSGLVLDNGSPCFNPNANLYTIAVMGATGLGPFAVTEYQLTATMDSPANGGSARRLTFGEPLTNVFLPDNMNANFTFEIRDGSQDLLVTATPNEGGEIILLVSKHSPTSSMPYCYQVAGGTNMQCVGWTWMATGGQSATSLYIPASNPCSPIMGLGITGVQVDPATCPTGTQLPIGRYYAVVYTTTGDFASFAIGVQAGAQQPMQLADGQPQLGQTGNVTVCPHRDPVSGVCPDASIAPLSRVASESFFQFSVPVADLKNNVGLDSYIMVERVCADDKSGYCGLPLHAMVRGCLDSACTQDDQFPSAQSTNIDGDFYVNDVQGAMLVPVPAACLAASAPYYADCNFYLGVAPVCGGRTTPGFNGIDCPSVLIKATWSNSAGIERIPSECNAPGNTCVLPFQNVRPAPDVRRYQAFFGTGNNVGGNIIASACYGDSQLSVCEWGSTTQCNPENQPGPNNNDYTGTTVATGSASWEDAHSGPLFIGISSMGNTGFSVVQLSITTGNSPQIFAKSPVTTVTRSSGSSLTVSYQPAMLQGSGAQPTQPVGVVYTAYAFPVDTIMPGWRLNVSCGVQFAAPQSLNMQSASVQDAYSMTVTGLDAATSYTVALVATCPAGTCLPTQVSDQSVAYTTVTVGPASGSGSGGGSNVAGPVVGVLLTLGAAGALWYWRKPIKAKLSSMGGPSRKGYAKYKVKAGGDMFDLSSAYEAAGPSAATGGYVPPSAGGAYSAL